MRRMLHAPGCCGTLAFAEQIIITPVGGEGHTPSRKKVMDECVIRAYPGLSRLNPLIPYLNPLIQA